MVNSKQQILQIKKYLPILLAILLISCSSGSDTSQSNETSANQQTEAAEENIETVKEPTIDANEEYLKINDIINQVNAKIIPNLKDNAKMIPKYVATPFPPLNFNQIGNIWAIKQIKAEK